MVENGYILCGVRVICAQRNDCNGFSYGGNGGDEKKKFGGKKKIEGGGVKVGNGSSVTISGE